MSIKQTYSRGKKAIKGIGGNDNSETLQEGFKRFILDLTCRNASKKTLDNYNFELNKFIKHVGTDALCSTMSNEIVQGYNKYLRGKYTNIASINTALRGSRTFLNFLHKEGYCNKIQVQLMKEQEKVRDCYTQQELEVLLKNPSIRNCPFTEYRNWAIITFMCAVPLRVNSICNLLKTDIDYKNSLVNVNTTKNRKASILPIPQHVLKVMEKYSNSFTGEYLFPNQFGELMTSNGMSHSLAKYVKGRGIYKERSIHLFRHSFCKNWIEQGGDIVRLSKFMQHSNLEMVKHYSNMYSDSLRMGTDSFILINSVEYGTPKTTIKR
jgi:integrase/recombinase XerD